MGMRSFNLFIYFIYLFLLVRANRPAPPVTLMRTDVKEAAFKLFCRSAFSFFIMSTASGVGGRGGLEGLLVTWQQQQQQRCDQYQRVMGFASIRPECGLMNWAADGASPPPPSSQHLLSPPPPPPASSQHLLSPPLSGSSSFLRLWEAAAARQASTSLEDPDPTTAPGIRSESGGGGGRSGGGEEGRKEVV